MNNDNTTLIDTIYYNFFILTLTVSLQIGNSY